MNIRHLSAALLASLSLCAPAAFAETFRCGQWLASPDMSVDELLEKCGTPTTKEVSVQDVYGPTHSGKGRNKVGTTTIETWTYDLGSQAYPMVVTIIDGTIKSMERGEK